MAKKYDNASRFFKDWTTKKLKDEAVSYHELIYKVECYGVRDMMAYDGILNELYKRGIEPVNELAFD